MQTRKFQPLFKLSLRPKENSNPNSSTHIFWPTKRWKSNETQNPINKFHLGQAEKSKNHLFVLVLVNPRKRIKKKVSRLKFHVVIHG